MRRVNTCHAYIHAFFLGFKFDYRRHAYIHAFFLGFKFSIELKQCDATIHAMHTYMHSFLALDCRLGLCYYITKVHEFPRYHDPSRLWNLCFVVQAAQSFSRETVLRLWSRYCCVCELCILIMVVLWPSESLDLLIVLRSVSSESWGLFLSLTYFIHLAQCVFIFCPNNATFSRLWSCRIQRKLSSFASLSFLCVYRLVHLYFCAFKRTNMFSELSWTIVSNDCSAQLSNRAFVLLCV